VNELLDVSFRILPPLYRDETLILEETRFSIRFLRTVAHLIGLRDDDPEWAIEDRARELSSAWQEQKLSGLFALDCPELRYLLAQIDDSLARQRFGPPILTPPGRPLIHVVHGVRPILRGHLEIVKSLRLAPVERAPTVALFITIFNDDNKLVRDNHHVGWHYHYCKPNGARSDTMLSFDTNQPNRVDKKGRIHNVPLFWERHGEGKAKFLAKAKLWGDEKRQNVWKAVQPELSRPLSEFRRPSDEASPVWPKSAVLSARPQSYSPR
jgi:hypothetical protein